MNCNVHDYLVKSRNNCILGITNGTFQVHFHNRDQLQSGFKYKYFFNSYNVRYTSSIDYLQKGSPINLIADILHCLTNFLHVSYGGSQNGHFCQHFISSFLPISFCQKNINTNCNHRKAILNTFVQKSCTLHVD